MAQSSVLKVVCLLIINALYSAYCETDTFMSRAFSGYSAGFQTRFVVENHKEDVQGYIGYMPSQSAIYVVFRGSTSIVDWLGNLDVVLTGYDKCEGCEVHKGFHEAQQSVNALVIQCVKDLRVEFPNSTVVVTGHSLGGAMATLTAIELVDAGLSPVRMFNFGSPRVGNHEFAEWASDHLEDHNRITHYRDVAVHVPSDHRFEHITGEWYEDRQHVIHACVGSNDKSCSAQFWLFFTNVDDHSLYLNLDLSCAGVTAVVQLLDPVV